ncbi:MAG: D-alanyl-D-alanine carboxypeptidase [Ruminococcaceae bacterium]|nr:D-alanyl-D-alanine carboxypeptidase [Oscillospiraceae bacterium]
MKKMFLRTAAALLVAVLFLPCRVYGVSAQKAIVMDAQTGRVYFEKDADSRSLIASTTKIMTALVVCRQCNVLDRVQIPKEAVGIEGSSMYLREGEVLTVQELLYGLMLHSGNDAAVALAIYCGGTVEGFVGLMNDQAQRLGLENTHFENPHGLDSPEHYSTARDLAVLAAYAMEDPIFSKTVATKTVRAGQRSLQNHNKLLWRLEGADGVKTGFTKAAGRILVSSAARNGRRVICVTINDGNDWVDHATLLENAFSRYTLRQIVSEGDFIGTVEVAGGQAQRVQLLADDDFSYPLADGEEPQILLSGPGFAYAPVVQGKRAGTAYVCIGDSCIGKIDVVYGQTVEQEEEKQIPFWKRLFGVGL